MIIPEGFATANIYLAVEDTVKYAKFIIEAFGGKEVGRSLRPNGNIANCQIRINTSVIMIASAGGFLKPSKSYIYLFVEDAAHSTNAAIAAGAQLVMELAEMPYGDLQSGIQDFEGNIWWISQRLTDKSYFD